MLPTAALLEPVQRKHPCPRFESPKVVFLTVKVGSYVMAEQRKEAGNGKCFVAVSEDRVIYRMLVKEVGKKGDRGVDGNHEENTDDTEQACQHQSISRVYWETYCLCSHGFR